MDDTDLSSVDALNLIAKSNFESFGKFLVVTNIQKSFGIFILFRGAILYFVQFVFIDFIDERLRLNKRFSILDL